jgi:hypothetical protein
VAERFVLYCKSYHRDLARVKRLVASIERHNRDRLPFYLSVPRADEALFRNELGHDRCMFVVDEDIITANPRVQLDATLRVEGRVSQAMVRGEFWRLGACDSYLCIDSDSEFLADFSRKHFVAPDDAPYTVMHENKELVQLALNLGIDKVAEELHAEIERFRPVFGRTGVAYSFAPSPFIWSATVWQSLDRQYLQPRGQTVWDAFSREMPEYLWYGEALLAYGAIPLHPIEPLFRVYHYVWQYYAMKKLGETDEKIARNYLGVIRQSNWEYEMDHGAPQKSAASRLVRRFKRGLRYLQAR